VWRSILGRCVQCQVESCLIIKKRIALVFSETRCLVTRQLGAPERPRLEHQTYSITENFMVGMMGFVLLCAGKTGKE
jgi:hypothetical protein